MVIKNVSSNISSKMSSKKMFNHRQLLLWQDSMGTCGSRSLVTGEELTAGTRRTSSCRESAEPFGSFGFQGPHRFQFLCFHLTGWRLQRMAFGGKQKSRRRQRSCFAPQGCGEIHLHRQWIECVLPNSPLGMAWWKSLSMIDLGKTTAAHCWWNWNHDAKKNVSRNLNFMYKQECSGVLQTITFLNIELHTKRCQTTKFALDL